MLRIHLILCLMMLAGGFWAVGLAQGRTWVVNAADDRASDAGEGTDASPLKTINAAAQLAQPGDTVRVHAGVYRERVSPAHSGEEGKPIVYQAAAGEKVFLRGSDVLNTDWQPMPDHPGVYVGSLASMKFGSEAYAGYCDPDRYGNFNPLLEYFNRMAVARPYAASVQQVKNQMDALRATLADQSRQDEWGRADNRLGPLVELHTAMTHDDPTLRRHRTTIGQLFVNGTIMRQVETLSQLRTVPGTWMVSPDANEVWLHPIDGPALSQRLIELTTRHAVFSPLTRGLGYITVRGFVIEHAAGFFPIWWDKQWPQAGALSCRSGHHWVIENNIIRYAGGIGLDIGREGHPTSIEYVDRWWNNTPRGNEGFLAAHTIRNNHIHDNGMAGINGWLSQRCVIVGNLIERNNRDGWAAPWWESGGIKLHQARDVIIEGNLIRDNNTFGIWLDNRYPNARITRNVIVANQWAGIFLEYGTDCLIDHNIIAHTRIGDGVYGHDINNSVVVHNLIQYNAGYGVYLSYAVPRGKPGSGNNRYLGCFRNRVLNNLILGNRQGAVGLPHDWELAKDNRSDFNLLMGVGEFMDGRKVQPPQFVVNSDAHSAPEERKDLEVPYKPMTRQRMFDELVAALAAASDTQAPPLDPRTFLDHPILTLAQWRAATGNDRNSVVDNIYVTRYDYIPASHEWKHRFTEALDTLKCEPVPGVERDYYGHPLGANPRPGPFQTIQPGDVRLIVWPVPGVPTTLGLE